MSCFVLFLLEIFGMDKNNINRRKAIKGLGLSSMAMAMGGFSTLNASVANEENLMKEQSVEPIEYERPVTAIVLGAGGRGNTYGAYALKNPKELDIIGVAEPIKMRIDKFSKSHKIDENNQFVTWEQVFEKKKFADAVIITTPDALHYGPAMKALEMGRGKSFESRSKIG